MSWKETCYIGDWSWLWERRFEGPDALKLFLDISVNSFSKFDIGQAKHVIHCNEDEKVIYGEDMKQYLAEYKAAMPGYTTTFNIAGSFEADDVSAWYRSPVELGWTKNIRFDHDFIGRKALEAEVADPKRTMVTLVWDADDVIGERCSSKSVCWSCKKGVLDRD